MLNRYVVHHHKTGRSHYDLRLVQEEVLRCWSLLREPPQKNGEQRLAIERESFDTQAIDSSKFEEEVFGVGNVYIWDRGVVDTAHASARCLILDFQGARLSGRYELKRMHWYPGNRWLLKKV